MKQTRYEADAAKSQTINSLGNKQVSKTAPSVPHHHQQDKNGDTSNKTAELGKRSIFYDPDWNPKGIAPYEYRNIPYNPDTFKLKAAVEPMLSGLQDIPLPSPKGDLKQDKPRT